MQNADGLKRVHNIKDGLVGSATLTHTQHKICMIKQTYNNNYTMLMVRMAASLAVILSGRFGLALKRAGFLVEC